MFDILFILLANRHLPLLCMARMAKANIFPCNSTLESILIQLQSIQRPQNSSPLYP